MTGYRFQFVPQFESRLGRDTEPVALDLNDGILAGEPEIALTTIAFLFANVSLCRLSQIGVRTAMLALYAAGAEVKLTRTELWALAAAPQAYANLFTLPENVAVPNGRLVNFALNSAKQRGHRQEIAVGSRLDNIGFKLIRLQQSACCLPQAENDEIALCTIAFEQLNPDPLRITAPSLGLAMLAIWAAGADVAISRQQYDQLVKDASALNRAQQSGCRSSRVNFVLDKAAQRDLAENLITEVAVPA